MSRLNLFGGAVLADPRGVSGLASRRHPMALLALLATAPDHTLSRGKLVGLLWSEAPEKTARNRLTSCVYDVRTALGEHVLVSVGGDLRFDAGALPCDVCLFLEALDAGRHADAVELYRGPFLDGFSIPDAVAFEQHIDVVRERLRTGYHRAIEELAREAEARSDFQTAAHWWRERVRAEPWSSRPVRSLMEALAAAGSPVAALHAARDHARVVRDEFDAEPAADVRVLADRLQAGLPAQPDRAREDGVVDLKTYQLYARGRGLIEQRTPHEMARAIDYFRAALDRDPGFALAWTGLADSVSLLEFYDCSIPASAPPALAAARRAVELAPDLGQAHASLGIAHCIRREGCAALRSLETAVDLAPDHSEAHSWLGWLRLMRGEPGAALHPGLRGVELDPLGPAFRAYLAETLLANRRPVEALRETVRAREIQPGYALAHFMEGLVLCHLERREEAEAAFRRSLDRAPPGGSPSHAEILAALAIVRIAAGDADHARALLAQIRRSAHAFSEGLVLAALGEIDAAFAIFERITDWTSLSNEHARYFFPTVLDPVRADRRFERVRRAIDRQWRGDP